MERLASSGVTLDWAVTRQVDASGAVTVYTPAVTGAFASEDPALGGADVLYGGVDNDWVFAGTGNLAFGGAGDDVYVFNRGDGLDAIDNTDFLKGTGNATLIAASDTLRLDEGIAESDVLAFQVEIGKPQQCATNSNKPEHLLLSTDCADEASRLICGKTPPGTMYSWQRTREVTT